MKLIRHLLHPLAALIALQLVWVLLVVLWIIWFIGKRQEYRELLARYQPELLAGDTNWLVLVQGLLLLLVILAGIYVIFIYWKRQADLYQQQRAALTQITHELKSPLASIQLHLETIQLRRPDQEKLDRFLDTMLSDTERLHNLINNLLLTARLERRRRDAPRLPVIDFSAFVESYLERFRGKLPEGGNLQVAIEPGIKVAIDSEGMETALRNLLENATLYSPGAPDITVSLSRQGQHCRLAVTDQGIGLARHDLKKVFAMFYRVRQPGENIRGSGLGLYIVRSVASEHGGSVSATSNGPGTGSTFTITLPLG
jgi:signal transduction histidine kinase